MGYDFEPSERSKRNAERIGIFVGVMVVFVLPAAWLLSKLVF